MFTLKDVESLELRNPTVAWDLAAEIVRVVFEEHGLLFLIRLPSPIQALMLRSYQLEHPLLWAWEQ